MFISKNKKTYGNYYLYYTGENGLRKSVSTKTSNRKHALEFLFNFKNNQQKSFIPSVKPLNKFSELEEKVMQYVRSNFRKGTQNIYSITIKNFKKILGNKKLNEITSHDIEFYKSCRLKEVSPTTCNIELSTLKSAFNIGMKFGWALFNPANSLHCHFPIFLLRFPVSFQMPRFRGISGFLVQMNPVNNKY
jgi:hypothetical protein